MAEQIPLFADFKEGVSFTNYFPASNADVVERLLKIVTNRDEPLTVIWGKSGVGKSHLLQACCQLGAANNLAVAYVPLQQYGNFSVELLDGLEQMQLLCIDDVHAIAGEATWELGLFNLFNRARESRIPLIFSASGKPSDLNLQLQDLTSRLNWGLLFHLKELSDTEKLNALQFRAEQRGFHLSTEVGRYLMQRSPRDMSTLFALLDKLDQVSLATHRKLTIPFVKQHL